MAYIFVYQIQVKLFPQNLLMMREKIDIYKQYAKTLLGNSESTFFAPARVTNPEVNMTDRIDEALFISFRRLFARDKLKKETFAMRFYMSASVGDGSGR